MQTNNLPDPEMFEDSSRVYQKKKKARRRMTFHQSSHGSGHGVNINSLLDILSVILVFLMKSYSSSVVQVKPSQALQVPLSHVQTAAQESLSVTVTQSHVLLNDMPILILQEGKAPQDAVRGLLIPSLLKGFDEQSKVSRGQLTVIADRRVSFELLSQVLYTAGQAEAHLGEFKFAVVHTERL